MFLLSVDEGSGLVSLEPPTGRTARRAKEATTAGGVSQSRTTVAYRLESWMAIGGFKTVKGWIEGDYSVLHNLLPAAEVYLTPSSGQAMRIEVTDIAGGRANIRLPRPLHGV